MYQAQEDCLQAKVPAPWKLPLGTEGVDKQAGQVPSTQPGREWRLLWIQVDSGKAMGASENHGYVLDKARDVHLCSWHYRVTLQQGVAVG